VYPVCTAGDDRFERRFVPERVPFEKLQKEAKREVLVRNDGFNRGL